MTFEKKVSDPVFQQLLDEGNQAKEEEPFFSCVLNKTIFSSDVSTFEELVAMIICRRLVQSCGSNPDVCPVYLQKSILEALTTKEYTEMGHLPQKSIREDSATYVRRDPACKTLLEVVLFFKGFAALVCHRAARYFWKKKNSRYTALWLQSQASSAFGVDIHPLAEIGCGVMLDHATGIVIGETATVGDGCTILHGVTLGGTGRESGDRHPKVGRDVLIGAGAKILGNIRLGDGSKIGAGSIVLRPVPSGATAVGVPAKIVGWAKEKRPGSTVDMQLLDVIHAGTETEISQPSSMTDDNILDSSGDPSFNPVSNMLDSFSKTNINEISKDETSIVAVTKNHDNNDNLNSVKTEMSTSKLKIESVSPKNKICTQKRQLCFSSSFFSSAIEEVKNDTDICSPFRLFLSCKSATQGCISYPELRCLLLHYANATDCQAGEIFFSLLQESSRPELGYIHPPEIFKTKFLDIAIGKAGLERQKCEMILNDFDQINNKRATVAE
uniref:serine O-acetyltransferase n=1 Tax=Eucampia antarctica TaxID=49252 RepID=A0A7S2WQ32_9STRA|mmetsp:Transcript_909/g.826  ORF Transcript_909/g.826 Transcript_909/m.826 type:complete len:498 (+) Transcript_909:117-1610(+)|eukprot:CAMPEP_0197829006 /NCGR_PEP_ID=MMETSP1437-20131217/5478_1 /TAXON_ID=49252 ORGANISM="Eucampia antarctica, Strain CCMP1452" /NCGR_SAMPLE_ID=MMETSP1437 /ASSEMBLY_ACC=CAM_ASM_001096 /LENGTH=497 /DNA_ID=CAMNT_0043430451 /DNA_START=117 /DNA_END=1610 /DNA_ORIENTATION=+